VEARVSVTGKSLTNSVVNFSYFSVCNANTTVAFGPGEQVLSTSDAPSV
jgi:hypothetical protein